MTLLAVLAVLTSQAPAAVPETETPAVIRGIIASAATKTPLRRADVTLQPMGVGSISGSAGGGGGFAGGGRLAGMKAVSDSEGNFVFTGVKPGTYMLTAQRSGFLMARYGARTFTSPGTRLTVVPGQELNGLRMEMIPQGVVAGRVVDEEGEPMQGVVVMALGSSSQGMGGNRRSRGGPGGGRGMFPVSQAQTDDRGEFRIPNLSPGKVILQIQPGRWGGAPVMGSGGDPARQEMGYVTTYYPGTTDLPQAAKIDVTAGAELAGFEVKLKRTPVARVRGKVLDASGAPAKNYFVNAMPQGSGFMGFVGQQFSRQADGWFELANVAPGSYMLSVRSDGGMRGSSHTEALQVGSQNIDNLVIRLNPPVAVKGHVVQEGEEKLDLARVRIMLTSEMPVFIQPGVVKDDGTFEVQNVSAGRYRVNVANLQGGYIDFIKYGGTDLSGDEAEISSSPDLLQVKVMAGGGSVSGVVTEDGKPGAGMVYLLPADPARRTTNSAKFATPDQNGAFTIKNLRPGDYLAFASEEPDTGFWDDPDEFRRIESKMKKVRVTKTGIETVELTIAR